MLYFTPIQFRMAEKKLKSNRNEALTKSLQLALEVFLVSIEAKTLLKRNSATDSLSVLNSKLTVLLQMSEPS